ncbi:AlpA family phage regulatory protein [Tardiphaga sp. vice352]|nr:AlpA family phage regulatory protein [Tardiphaga sp. vice352]
MPLKLMRGQINPELCGRPDRGCRACTKSLWADFQSEPRRLRTAFPLFARRCRQPPSAMTSASKLSVPITIPLAGLKLGKISESVTREPPAQKHHVRPIGHPGLMETYMVRKALRLPAVLDALACSKATWYAGIKKGVYPKGKKLNPDGNIVVWFDDEIAAIQAAALQTEAA